MILSLFNTLRFPLTTKGMSYAIERSSESIIASKQIPTKTFEDYSSIDHNCIVMDRASFTWDYTH
jgi:hypothetical protein